MWVVIAGLTLASACAPDSPSETAEPGEIEAKTASSGRGGAGESVILSVDGETTTRREFERQLEQMPDYVRARFKSADTKRNLLGALAQFEVLADVAERRDLGEAPAVRDALESELQRRMLREAIRERLSIEEISDESVQAYYDDHPGNYQKPERRAALVIVTESEDRARRIREELAEATGSPDERIKQFRTFASHRSVDPETAGRGGAIGWVRPPGRESDHPEIADVVFELEERVALSDVFRSGDRWYVATWHRRKPARQQPLEEVASEIRTHLFEKRRSELREQLLSEWRANADVDVSAELESELEAPDPPRRTQKSEIPLRTVGADDSTKTPSNDGSSR